MARIPSNSMIIIFAITLVTPSTVVWSYEIPELKELAESLKYGDDLYLVDRLYRTCARIEFQGLGRTEVSRTQFERFKTVKFGNYYYVGQIVPESPIAIMNTWAEELRPNIDVRRCRIKTPALKDYLNGVVHVRFEQDAFYKDDKNQTYRWDMYAGVNCRVGSGIVTLLSSRAAGDIGCELSCSDNTTHSDNANFSIVRGKAQARELAKNAFGGVCKESN